MVVRFPQAVGIIFASWPKGQRVQNLQPEHPNLQKNIYNILFPLIFQSNGSTIQGQNTLVLPFPCLIFLPYFTATLLSHKKGQMFD